MLHFRLACVSSLSIAYFSAFALGTLRTAVVLHFGDVVVPEFKLLLRGPLVQFIATGRTLLLSPMQLTTCLDVAQTAIFFFHCVHSWLHAEQQLLQVHPNIL